VDDLPCHGSGGGIGRASGLRKETVNVSLLK
jgi:hypothetical protein